MLVPLLLLALPLVLVAHLAEVPLLVLVAHLAVPLLLVLALPQLVLAAHLAVVPLLVPVGAHQLALVVLPLAVPLLARVALPRLQEVPQVRRRKGLVCCCSTHMIGVTRHLPAAVLACMSTHAHAASTGI